MALPASTRYLVIGAGIHGLSTAFHLAGELEQRGLGAGSDILVVDKHSPGAGASGIACGVVRNNYFQPAMSELMQACVEVWESDPAAYAYNPVGYMALGAKAQVADLTATAERQEKIGYRSRLVLGEREVDEYMKALFPDWRARGVHVLLHELQGGFAFNVDSVMGLNSPMFVRTVKLKDFPWNGWLALGIDAAPIAAWNPIAGFTDNFGQLMWSAVGDPALIPAPNEPAWMLNRISDVQSRRMVTPAVVSLLDLKLGTKSRLRRRTLAGLPGVRHACEGGRA